MLAQLSVIEDQSEALSQVFTQPILFPPSPQSIAELSPMQPFNPWQALTPQILSSPL